MATRKQPCQVCGSMESAMVFTSDPWCCDDHRKAYQAGVPDRCFLVPGVHEPGCPLFDPDKYAEAYAERA